MHSAIVVMAGLISMTVSGLFFLAIDAYFSAAASHGFPPAVRLPFFRLLHRPPQGRRARLNCQGAIWKGLRAPAPHLQNSPVRPVPWPLQSVPLRFWAPAEGPLRIDRPQLWVALLPAAPVRRSA